MARTTSRDGAATARPDNTLLTVRGFDPQPNRFHYVVNERFGNTSGSATAVRQPFQLSLNVRYAIGYDPRTLQIQSLGRGNTAPPNAKTLVDSFLVRFNRQNAANAALARKDSLALPPAQVAQLQCARRLERGVHAAADRLAHERSRQRAEGQDERRRGAAAHADPRLQR